MAAEKIRREAMLPPHIFKPVKREVAQLPEGDEPKIDAVNDVISEDEIVAQDNDAISEDENGDGSEE